MDLYKPILKHIIMPLWARWENSPYLEHLKYLEKSQYFSEDKIKEIYIFKTEEHKIDIYSLVIENLIKFIKNSGATKLLYPKIQKKESGKYGMFQL